MRSFGGSDATLASIAGLSWRSRRRRSCTTRTARSRPPASARSLPYERLGNPRHYLARTFLGNRTTGYQAALGCRFRCTFCGVAAMFRGKTALPPAAAAGAGPALPARPQFGVDSIQFYDHNFFDREVDMVPLLEVLAQLAAAVVVLCALRCAVEPVGAAPGRWCRKSRLRMAYIGAESPSDWLLHDIRKGTRTDQTLEAVEICRSNGVIPELSFMLAPPQDPEGETERTFEFIRHVKRVHPETEIMLYIYTPLPPAPGKHESAGRARSQQSARC